MKSNKIDNFKNKEQMLLDLEYQLIRDFIKIRKEEKLSQQEMGEASKTIRETIAKIENQIVSPQVSTLIKILYPLGYTIKIEKIKENK